jgi:hypothetical protein
METRNLQKSFFTGGLPLILPILLLLLISCNRERMVTVDLTPAWDTTRVLENPDKGWYHHMLDNGIGKYLIRDEELFHSFPGLDHLYLRLAWAYLEPEEGVYNWEVIDTIIDRYVPMGYGISFRISCKETGWVPNSIPVQINGVGYATPPWVREAGAKGTVPGEYGPPVWTPDWDDPVFLDKLDNFHRAFAERYDGKPWVRYVDVGSIGEWGEGNAHRSTNIPPTLEEVKANIDIYLKHYTKSQIVVTDALLFWRKPGEDVKELYEYAVSNGITLRDDSPMVEFHMNAYRDTWSISHPHFYNPLYLEKPIILELAHYRSVKRNGLWLGRNGADTIPGFGVPGAEFFRKSVEIMHATWIGYHGYAEDFLTENPGLTVELLNRCGYWYFPVSISYPAVLRRGEENALEIEVLNKGVAPAYENYAMVLVFEPADGSGSFRVIIPDAENRAWLPDEQTGSKYRFRIPAEAAAGDYLFKMKLQKNRPERIRDVHLAVEESIHDQDNFLMIGDVIIR